MGKKTAEPRAKTPDGVPVFCSFDEIISIEQLIDHPRNPNQHPKEQIELLGRIIKEAGWRQPVTVSRRSGFIIKGHGRKRAALFAALQYVPVDYQDYESDAAEWADMTADNRIAELSAMDETKLVELLSELADQDALELTGYTAEDLDGFLAELCGEEGTEGDGVDDAPEPPENPITLPGDIWTLGSHRLICGDATDPEVIRKLMDGQKAQLVNTDPPYGVSYESQSGKFDKIQNDDKTGDDLITKLLLPVFRNYVAHTADDAAFYIWHASSTRRDYEDAMTAAGLQEKQYLIWVKENMVLGHADYQWAHEPCFYAQKAGQSAAFYGDRSQRTAWKVTLRESDRSAVVLTGGVVLTDGAGGKLYVSDKPPKNKKMRHIRLRQQQSATLVPGGSGNDVWEVARETGAEHPTQKPVELAIRAINNSAEPGGLVVDFFGGSGFTLLGAEMTGRRAYLCELEPKYCDLIVRRYIDYSGNEKVTCLREGMEVPYTELKNPEN